MSRKYVRLIICCLVVLFTAPTVFGESKNKEKDLHIEEFGTTIGEPIDSGFVFYDGRYIDAPYIVAQKGLGIFINDVMIRPPIEWPQPDLTQDTDPELPKGITLDSTEKDIGEHSSKKYRYFLQHYPKEEAVQKMVEYYRSLPCIREVKVIDMQLKEVEPNVIPEFGFIKLIYFSDESLPLYVQIHDFSDTGLKFDKESVSQRLKDSKKYFEEQLKENECYFFGNPGEISFITDEQELLQTAQICRSKKSVET